MGVQERRGSFEVYVYRPDFGKKVYVGTRKTELEARALFRDKTAEFAESPPANHIALGIAAEHFAIGELLSRGHAVAKPVVDIDGVDLIVDYAVKVQIKSSTTAQRANRYKATTDRPSRARQHSYLSFHTARKRVGQPNRPYLVDVFLFYDRPNSAFYVVPADVVPKGGTLALCPKYEEYRDAWDWFRERAA